MDNAIPTNPVLDKLPQHLYQYVHPQNYERYTPINQAVWRYVMRRNIDYLSRVAHNSYIEGLQKTGISIDTIPSMYGMNRILQDIGWAAVAVDGFIPPAAFMEFQAYNVLVIASDIRQLEHITYTPAPDIIHESAGHAPIIANPEYAEYLRRFGEIGCKAISSEKDYELYEAVRHLSILKEKENTPPTEINKAKERVDYLQRNMGAPSEMALIRNLHWWTVEYGLIGTIENPKIYGAGLLSSIGESKWCLSDSVKKHSYSLQAAYQSFDITQPQPQLFVTPDFAHLSLVLEEFANTMALRRGGLKGLQKLINSKQLGSIELSTGLQISGIFSQVLNNGQDKVAFIKTVGPTALAYREKELIGHSTNTYAQGFGSPIGRLKGINLAIEDMSPRDLEAYNIFEGRYVQLEFEGNIFLEGEVVTGTRNLQGKILLITFKNCTVKHQENILFQPQQGYFHLAVGKEVAAAYAGPADLHSFDLTHHELSSSKSKSIKPLKTVQLENLYEEIRAVRSGNKPAEILENTFAKVLSNYSNEWLLLLELYEETTRHNLSISKEVYQRLKQLKVEQSDYTELIEEGLRLL